MMISTLARWSALALALALLSGCASGPNATPGDPMEPLNRNVYRFNEVIDDAVLEPVARGYRRAVPQIARTGVTNFFGNLGDLWSSVNAGLQLRPKEAAENLVRFGVNTTFGLVGILDVASEVDIPRTRLDFGQTLGRWGVQSGPYLVLPILGPSSVRDTAGLVADMSADLVTNLNDVAVRNSLTAVRVVDVRAGLLGATSLLEEAALDPYRFTRDFYLNRRQSQIEDIVQNANRRPSKDAGEPPPDEQAPRKPQ